jgi:hypothetical protein
MIRITALVFAILLSQVSGATPDHNHTPPVMPKEFDTLKGLVGTWVGTTDMGDGKQQAVTVVYELTSGGTALTEKLGPGTPMEMISVYHKEGKSLGMTHYCAVGNQPHMKLKKADAKSMAFEMVGNAGISSPKESHMHAVTLSIIDANTLKHEWVNYEDGKKKMTGVFTFKRKI